MGSTKAPFDGKVMSKKKKVISTKNVCVYKKKTQKNMNILVEKKKHFASNV